MTAQRNAGQGNRESMEQFNYRCGLPSRGKIPALDWTWIIFGPTWVALLFIARLADNPWLFWLGTAIVSSVVKWALRKLANKPRTIQWFEEKPLRGEWVLAGVVHVAVLVLLLATLVFKPADGWYVVWVLALLAHILYRRRSKEVARELFKDDPNIGWYYRRQEEQGLDISGMKTEQYLPGLLVSNKIVMSPGEIREVIRLEKEWEPEMARERFAEAARILEMDEEVLLKALYFPYLLEAKRRNSANL